MKITDLILFESYKDAYRIFSKNNDESLVKDYIETFKKLSQKQLIDYKDISYWVKEGWNSFVDYVDKNRHKESNRQQKKKEKSNKIILYNNGNLFAIVPLNHSASKYYGRSTKWCTSSYSPDDWNEYFKKDKFVLIYVFSDKNKYAIRFDDIGSTLYDDTDEEISEKEFVSNIGISSDYFINLAYKHIDTIRKYQNQ